MIPQASGKKQSTILDLLGGSWYNSNLIERDRSGIIKIYQAGTELYNRQNMHRSTCETIRHQEFTRKIDRPNPSVNIRKWTQNPYKFAKAYNQSNKAISLYIKPETQQTYFLHQRDTSEQISSRTSRLSIFSRISTQLLGMLSGRNISSGQNQSTILGLL